MNPRDEKQSQFFDDCARRGILVEFSPEEDENVRQLLDKWAIRPGERVLEPGCGAGRLTRYLDIAVQPEGTVVACDLSEEMLSILRNRGLSPSSESHRVSVFDLPITSQSFDKVICFCVFPHFEDPLVALQFFHRVLKPGGDLWICHLEGSATLNAFHRGAGETVSRDRLTSGKAMERLVTDAGFEIAHFKDEATGYTLHAVCR
jgi:ubiquinone/menaquinone biosynthesis C-methylase UbiE